jgi:hypothetical protein
MTNPEQRMNNNDFSDVRITLEEEKTETKEKKKFMQIVR